MKNLKTILNCLKNNCSSFNGSYFIPEVWNVIKFNNYSKDPARKGQIGVNPYSFMISCIKDYILVNGGAGKDYLMPLDHKNGNRDLNLGRSVIYGMLPRMFTAWDHYRQGEICTGTFLKAMCLLLYLKNLKVNIIYLLPIFERSQRYKKGEIGSPYAIKNLYRIDHDLHDNLLGAEAGGMIEMEFKAFIEACHLLGIKVMLDFTFRTVSRDNDLLREHPDWFYWIKCDSSRDFMPPAVETEPQLSFLNNQSLKNLYTCRGIREFLGQFSRSPKELDPGKWERLLEESLETGDNLLDLIEENYQITTAPGFSNVLNDPQPPWSDITYLRFYHDVHKKARPYLMAEQPPYILQDVVCLNLYRGEHKNRDLWDYCLGVIPYYQENYGIDGARIDMGHALPPELNREIVARVKAANKNFILWSEELANKNSRAAKEHGFHFISGDLWFLYKKVEKPGFYKKLIRKLTSAEIPVTATLETPDTPRFAHEYRDKRKMELILWLNFFLPKAIPFINNGMELLERQPMNLGLDNNEAGRFVLEKQDPMYGKLAFFDNYRLHWLNHEGEWLRQLLSEILALRSRFMVVLEKERNFFREYSQVKNKKLILLCYLDRETGANLFFLANKSFDSRARINLKNLLPAALCENHQTVRIIRAGGNVIDTCWDIDKTRFLNPGDVIIGYRE